MINSAAATGVAEIATLPICIVKTNYQNSRGSLREVIARLYAQGGIRAFYRASAPAVFSQMISTSSKYTFYRKLETIPWMTNKMVNGLIGGILSSLITHPIDFVKIHWQMRAGRAMIDMISREGPRIIYRGYSKSFAKVCVSSAMFYPLYDYAKAFTDNTTLSACISAVISTTAMQPIDYLKTRHIYGKKIYHANPWIYYRGLSLNLARVVPHFMITMTIIDMLLAKSN
jgi:intracellular septation protein A